MYLVKLDIPSGEEGGIYIEDISSSSMDTRDYTVSVEYNELFGREVLKKRFPDCNGMFTKSIISWD